MTSRFALLLMGLFIALAFQSSAFAGQYDESFSNTDADKTNSPEAPPASSPATATPAESNPSSVPQNPSVVGLRKRDSALSWSYSAAHFDTTLKATGVESNSNSNFLSLEYAHNFGRFELGALLSGSVSDFDGAKNTSAFGGLVGRWNIIKNTPGNDWVPYASGYVVELYKAITDDSSDDHALGLGLGGGLGFNWFPFSQIFAVNVEYSYISGTVKATSSPQVETDIKQSMLNIGWKIYF